MEEISRIKLLIDLMRLQGLKGMLRSQSNSQYFRNYRNLIAWVYYRPG